MFKKLVGLLTVAVTGLLFSGLASAQLVGSSHDLTVEIPALSNACQVCHAPHANLNADTDMLWNHVDSTVLAGGYTVYSSPTLDAVTAGQPGATSLLCLSCHDGTVAVDSYGLVVGTQTIDTFTNGGTAFGVSLGNDHPIGISYDDQIDLELNIDTTAVNFNTTVASAGTVADLLFSDIVECGSCHDVHNTQSNAGAAGEGLLRVSNTGSTLCLACHKK
jgi:predicted CXXCH cytochrome family protein